MSFFHWLKNALFSLVYLALIACAFYACASIGSPQGGEYDMEPPKLLRSNPLPNTVNFSKNKIELLFDEYISIEKPTEKVIITPPQKKMPLINAIGKKITVELKDSMLLNTTYTFDFTDGIVDNNEKNVIEGFTFAFSTGEVIDSLIISGIVLNAENLEPVRNVTVGLHANLADSAFTTLPFVRTSQTNNNGRFWIRNVSPGTYRIFALQDINRSYTFDLPNEAIAVDDSLIVPDFVPAMRMDTLWKDSLTIDTIKEVHYNRFLPDDIRLFLFTETHETQYFSKAERISDRQFVLNFNSDTQLPPDLCIVEEKERENDWYISEFSPDKKTLTYWITDSLLYKRDSLNIEMNYWKTDSLSMLIPQTDTLLLAQRKKVAPKPEKTKGKNKDEKEKIEFLDIKVSTSGLLDVYDTVKITFSEPVLPFYKNNICFFQKVDTLWEERSFPVIQDSLNPRIFYLENFWPYGKEYQITVDSASIFSIYGKWNNSMSATFKTQLEEEYGNLYVTIKGVEPNGFGELLDGSEKVIKVSQVYDGELIFEDIKPGKYFLRYIDDKNGNGKWDTGNYSEGCQPEAVYYFPSFFEIRKFSDYEHTWNVTELAVEKQKPLDITKNKPEVKKTRKTERDEERRNPNQRQDAPNSATGRQPNNTTSNQPRMF
jgi:hypothetical protein